MRRLSILGAVALCGAALAMIGGCQSVLPNHDAYYLHSPAQKTFLYRMHCPDGSMQRGTVTVDVTHVAWPEDDSGIYEMRLKARWEIECHFVTVPMLRMYAPKDIVEAATEHSPPASEPSDVIISDIGRRRFRPLPVDGTSCNRVQGASVLVGAKGYATELALVWLKPLSPLLATPQSPKADFSISNVGTCSSACGQTLIFDLDAQCNGRPFGAYTCTFVAGRSLTAVHATLEDGTRIDLDEK